MTFENWESICDNSRGATLILINPSGTVRISAQPGSWIAGPVGVATGSGLDGLFNTDTGESIALAVIDVVFPWHRILELRLAPA